MNILFTWQFWGFIIAICGLLFSIFNLILGKLVAGKIQGNDLKHLTTDVSELQKEYREREDKIILGLGSIDKRLGRIERRQAVTHAICNERHKLKLNKRKNSKKKLIKI